MLKLTTQSLRMLKLDILQDVISQVQVSDMKMKDKSETEDILTLVQNLNEIIDAYVIEVIRVD